MRISEVSVTPYRFSRWLSVLPLMLFSAGLLHGQSTNVLTWQNNIWRDGKNATETTLTQATLNSSQFGKICSTAPGAIDGQIYAQPLVVTGSIPGHNHVVYIETQNDSVYFIDGDSPNCAVIKRISLLQDDEEPVECHDVGGRECTTFNPIVGIVGTPVIDISSNTMYLVTWTESTAGTCSTQVSRSCFTHRLHALDITTGAEKYKGPVTIPSVTIGESTFFPIKELQRPGLLLLPHVEANGHSAVYVAFSSMDGSGVVGKSIPNGWVFSFDAKNLSVAPVAWTTTPDGEGGGIWMSGAGLAAAIDKPGGNQYIFVATGDGTFDAENGGSDYGDSFVKLTTNLTVSDYFTPYNQYCDDFEDTDFGSGGVMLMPNGTASSTIDFAIANGKDGNIYVMDRANAGGYQGPNLDTCPTSGTNLNYESFSASTKRFYSTGAFWNNHLYSIANNSPLRKYKISGTSCDPAPICTTPTASTAISFGFGSAPGISSNNNITGTAIAWAIKGNGWPTENQNVHPAPAVLYAFDAEHNTSHLIPELWDSTQCPTRDIAGNSTKFAVPTIANGRVFIGTMDPTDATNTNGELDIYGPTNNPCI
ncbi:MAG: hypothetical protein WB952_07795 [Terriglobales bacterium]